MRPIDELKEYIIDWRKLGQEKMIDKFFKEMTPEEWGAVLESETFTQSEKEIVEDKIEKRITDVKDWLKEHQDYSADITYWLAESRALKDNFYEICIWKDLLTREEKENYENHKKALMNLIEECPDKHDLYRYIRRNANEDDLYMYDFMLYAEGFGEYCEIARKEYETEISLHRQSGDLVDYAWKIYEEEHDMVDPLGLAENRFHPIIEAFSNKLSESEKEEICTLTWNVVQHLTYDDYLQKRDGNAFKYIIKLAQSNHDSLEYKRYMKIYDRLSYSSKKFFDDYLKEQEEERIRDEERKRRYEREQKLDFIFCVIGGIIGCAALITGIILGIYFFKRHLDNTKDARLAKQEAQRIEKELKKKEKEEKKAQELAAEEAIKEEKEKMLLSSIANKNLKKSMKSDLEQMIKLASNKLSRQELFISTPEPSLYVIAPMSYDTKKFVEDNSHDKGLFGTTDNSAERLTILESCITDFQNKVDIKTGVSFLDRSKIEQIEREHKFQLGDWSNNTKTAEVGKALNANILLFLDKFGFIDSGSGEYHFEAKFVDINTMQSASFNIVYSNAKKKIVTPATVETISFRDFSSISTKKNPFEDELALKTIKTLRTVQKKDMKETSPLGDIVKIELSEYDGIMPKSNLYEVSTLSFDGFGSVGISSGSNSENASYSFEPVEMNLIKSGNDYYTDGKIGTLTIESKDGYKKHDVFTRNGNEYFIKISSAETEKIIVNYYLQMVELK